MLLVSVVWIFAPPLRPTTEEELRSTLLRQDARRAGRLEHVRVHLARGSARGVLFLRADDESAALSYARTLWSGVQLGNHPQSTWNLADCSLLRLPIPPQT
ncbi:hypothetical protein OG897_26750 [Streptomyces sp. NBC_00237]|uniref:hypothetical protein n=1 Tax=Streptomyces sp. NBC_00237 TaxID=2975687 RepID=UPI00225AD263|nr:hypothetical protein [Streptomyces sp. NBC_00237]MCX5205044.1 hypothetical protein [Streptomyces sp. NBC_00237]